MLSILLKKLLFYLIIFFNKIINLFFKFILRKANELRRESKLNYPGFEIVIHTGSRIDQNQIIFKYISNL